MSALRWTNKSTEAMAEELTRQGHPVSDKTVARCLRKMGYSMQLNQKTREGPQHRNRDQQFRYINRQVASFRKSGDPALSVDTNVRYNLPNASISDARPPDRHWTAVGAAIAASGTGPLDATRHTTRLSGDRTFTDVPATGLWLMTSPAATVLLDWTVTAPRTRPAPVIAVEAAACVIPAAFGTDRRAIQGLDG